MNKHLEIILIRLKVNKWSLENLKSSREISMFLVKASKKYLGTSGYISVLKAISNNLKDTNSLKWFNHFSQIRCAYYLTSIGVNITAFEKKNNQKKVDLELNSTILCELKSFTPTMQRSEFSDQIDEFVINNFLNKKLYPAFEEQGANLLLIDDIFADNSKNYRFLNYFLGFVDETDSDRGSKIKDLIDKYLPSLLVLSFIDSMTTNPQIRFVGDNWNKLDCSAV